MLIRVKVDGDIIENIIKECRNLSDNDFLLIYSMLESYTPDGISYSYKNHAVYGDNEIDDTLTHYSILKYFEKATHAVSNLYHDMQPVIFYGDIAKIGNYYYTLYDWNGEKWYNCNKSVDKYLTALSDETYSITPVNICIKWDNGSRLENDIPYVVIDAE